MTGMYFDRMLAILKYMACAFPFYFTVILGTVFAEDKKCACKPQSCLQFDNTIELNGTVSSVRMRYTDQDGYDYLSYFLKFDSPLCIALAGSSDGFTSQKIQIVPNDSVFMKDDFKVFKGRRVHIAGGLISAYREDHRMPTLLIVDQIN